MKRGTSVGGVGEQVVEALAGCPLFEGLPREVLRQIAGFSLVMATYEGQTLLEEGDPPGDFLVVLKGRLRAQVESICPPMEVSLYRVCEGDIACESSLLHPESGQGETITCTVGGSVLRVSIPPFRAFLTNNPEWASEILWRMLSLISQRVDDLNHRLVSRARLRNL